LTSISIVRAYINTCIFIVQDFSCLITQLIPLSRWRLNLSLLDGVWYVPQIFVCLYPAPDLNSFVSYTSRLTLRISFKSRAHHIISIPPRTVQANNVTPGNSFTMLASVIYRLCSPRESILHPLEHPTHITHLKVWSIVVACLLLL
jgi:hypothetical protein